MVGGGMRRGGKCSREGSSCNNNPLHTLSTLSALHSNDVYNRAFFIKQFVLCFLIVQLYIADNFVMDAWLQLPLVIQIHCRFIVSYF